MIAGLLALAAVFGANSAGAAANSYACPGCNVILLSIDTLRADALSAYGYGRDTSPNLSRLASRGVLFENDLSQFPTTLASHASIMTGQYPWKHGLRTMYIDTLSTGSVTLAQVLQAHGYRTVWAALVGDPSLSLEAGLGRGFDEEAPPKDTVFDWTSEALSWLRRHKDRRFFMFLHTYRTHDPYEPDAQAVRRFSARPVLVPRPTYAEAVRAADADVAAGDVGELAPDFAAAHSAAFSIADARRRGRAVARLLRALSKEKRQDAIDPLVDEERSKAYWSHFDIRTSSGLADARLLYDACVYQADQGVGALYDELEKLGLADKTILVVTSDHGEEFMEHGRIRHSQDYIETMHVPLLFVFPKSRAGVRRGEIVRSVDIMPTILDSLGLPDARGVQGRSLLPLIAGRKDGPRFSFAEGPVGFSVRDARFTYLVRSVCGDGRMDAGCMSQEFYDRSLDPGERYNLFVPSSPLARRYRAILAARLARDGETLLDPWLATLGERPRRDLIQMGYW